MQIDVFSFIYLIIWAIFDIGLLYAGVERAVRSQLVGWRLVQKASVGVFVDRAAFRYPDVYCTVVPLHAVRFECIERGLSDGLNWQVEVPAVWLFTGWLSVGSDIGIHQTAQGASLGENVVQIDCLLSLANPVPEFALSLTDVEEEREGALVRLAPLSTSEGII